jgi:GntR family transcriptional regulator / MocR family aminotransferase
MRNPPAIVPMIVVDRKAAKPLYMQIYDAYRAAIVERRLRSGQQIPSTRSLASELGVSRFPVLNAYAQLLAEGYFESRVGAGTIVSSSLPEQALPNRSSNARRAAASSGPRPVSRRSSILPTGKPPAWSMKSGAFSIGEVASDQFPLHIWSNLVARHARNMTARSFHYGDQTGSMHLREMIASYLRTSRSLRCEAEQIMVVSGSQQALELSARVLLDPGSPVWIEEPGYRLTRDVLTLAGCNLVPVPVDKDGLNVAAGIRLSPKARAAFVTPSHQYPLGVTMSASRRLQLLDWAQASGAWIVEDDYDSEYRYESLPIASLQGLDAHARVIYIGTFSKVLFPSLRLGYLVLPPDLVDRFLAIRRTMDIGPPTFYQEVLAEFIGEGHFARHIRRMRGLYRERRSILVDSLRKEIGPSVEILGGEAGMHLAMTLPHGDSDLAVSERAARQKLWIWPLSPSYLNKPRQGFVLGYGGTSAAEIPRAVRKLRDVLAARK